MSEVASHAPKVAIFRKKMKTNVEIARFVQRKRSETERSLSLTNTFVQEHFSARLRFKMRCSLCWFIEEATTGNEIDTLRWHFIGSVRPSAGVFSSQGCKKSKVWVRIRLFYVYYNLNLFHEIIHPWVKLRVLANVA